MIVFRGSFGGQESRSTLKEVNMQRVRIPVILILALSLFASIFAGTEESNIGKQLPDPASTSEESYLPTGGLIFGSGSWEAAPSLSETTGLMSIDSSPPVSSVTASCTLPPGHYDLCTVCGPCEEGEGDCDSDDECQDGLTCASDIGQEYGLGEFVDVCVDSQSSCPVEPGNYDYCELCGPCTDEQGDCDSDSDCAEGLVCGQDLGSGFDFWWDVDVCISADVACPLSPGDEDYCKVCGPCAAEVGDCDDNSECETGLTCVNDVGRDYGFGTFTDVCIDKEDECPLTEGHPDYCAICGPCEENIGDCDGDSECSGDLICVNNVGLRFTFTADTDVCLAGIEPGGEDDCPVEEGHYDYCALCGPCDDEKGDCDSDSECAEGLVCLSDVGLFYGWAEDVDVCRPEGASECPEVVGEFGYCGNCGPCMEGEGDCDGSDDCEEGLVCVSGAGADFGFEPDVDVCLAECPVPPGDPEFCSLCGPCGEGEGDCDGSGDCAQGLVCREDVGDFFGFAPDVDVCLDDESTCTEPLGDYSYCRLCGPCEEGEGDCDADNECAEGLTCVNEVGPDFGFVWDVDVCLPKSVEECTELLGTDDYCQVCGPCEEGKGDCDRDDDCADGLICASNVGADYGFDPSIDVCQVDDPGVCELDPGDPDYCEVCGPCGDGEGDCDSDSECTTGLTCVADVGEDYGWASEVDVCLVNEECQDLIGTINYCLVCGPCGEGQGDCDEDSDCASGLYCVNNLGADYGWDWEVDVCISPSEQCPVPVSHYDYCAICGPCEQGEGDCDSDSECQAGLTCSPDVGIFFDWPEDVDVCQVPSGN